MSPKRPTFRLFRSTSSANRCEYVGTVTTPDGQIYAIEANVSEHDKPDGTKGKHFEGHVFPSGHLTRQMLRSAKVDGQTPDDLIKLMQGPDPDLNDKLPEAM
jgi:hypothetical protein